MARRRAGSDRSGTKKPASSEKPRARRKTTTAEKPRATGAEALAKRAEALQDAKRERLAREGLADVALVKRRFLRIREDFFDVGEALVRLKRPAVVAALGYASFHQLCERALGMSGSQADDLVRIASRLSREVALAHDRTRASALLGLADATPADDLEAILAGGVVELPGEGRVDVGATPTPELLETAKRVRARVRGRSTGRGRTTTADEREAATAAQSRLRAAGPKVRVTAVATRPGQPCEFRISGLDRAGLDRLARSFGRARG